MALTALYARVSTDEQVEHGTSLDEQVRLCRERAGPDAETAEFVDAGITGTTMERPGLAALLARARRGELCRVVAYDPDRLSRNVTHLLLIVDELRRHGAEVEFVNFRSDLSPDGRLLFTVRGAISEFEAHRIKQRMYAGKQARARAGQVASGTPIYGYRLDRATKRWEAETAEAEVVRLLFDWAVDAGTWEIARRLNEHGVPARFGGRWAQSSVIGMLRNETYLGRMRQMEGLGHVPVPPLVTREQFDRVQRALQARRNRPQGRSTHPYLLTGRLRCGLCGRSMCGGYGRPAGAGAVTYYGCTAKARPQASGQRCASRFWRSDHLDGRVWAEVLGWLSDPSAWHEAAAPRAAGPEAEVDLASQRQGVERAAQRLEAERARMLRAFRRGVIGEDDLQRQGLELEAEGRVLQQRREALRAALRGVGQGEDPLRCEEVIAQIMADAPGLDPVPLRRAALAALGVTVTLGPGEAARVRLQSPP